MIELSPKEKRVLDTLQEVMIAPKGHDTHSATAAASYRVAIKEAINELLEDQNKADAYWDGQLKGE